MKWTVQKQRIKLNNEIESKFKNPVTEIDSFIHEPVRLGILLLLKIHHQLPFAEIQKALQITSGNLNSHLTKLQEKKYVIIEKRFVDLRPRTVIFLSKEGKSALSKYIGDFSKILNGLEE